MRRISNKGLLKAISDPDSKIIEETSGFTTDDIDKFWDWAKVVTAPDPKAKPHISLSKDPPYWLVEECGCKIEGYITLGKNFRFPYIENHKKGCEYE